MIGKAKSKVREAKASYDEAAGADPAQTSPGESKVASSSASADNGAKVAKAVGEPARQDQGHVLRLHSRVQGGQQVAVHWVG